ncbi:cyclic nucleotide-binding domain-containing protein [Rubrobacter tropicus]|uniref:histidine kinase n=1 Tax=Rubrobacter tropicus TaxID=2653851 RepID=A0A6G8Q7W3_9ACTN|nr:ATP-binding protein [Rubrobacter tropicus]QIN82561.1 cyclic nucleotide-binding domain-containing protein [Rubrobacter tropicus]
MVAGGRAIVRAPNETRADQEEQRLTHAQLGVLSGYGRELQLEEGDYLFDEKGVVDSFYVVVEGEVGISRLDGAEETRLVTHGPGEFTGGLAVLTGKRSIHRARANAPTRVIEIDAGTFRRLAVERPELGDAFISGLAQRMRVTQRAFRQQEKLAALGKLSAGLAHELNNPAAAASRASEELGDAILAAQLSALEHDARFSAEGREGLAGLLREITSRPATTRDPLSSSDAEDALASWLEDRGVEDSWDLAPPLSAAGVEERDLEGLSASSGGELTGAVRWLAGTLELSGLTRELSVSVGRVSRLVGAMKEYTYMDRATHSEVDVARGLENTITVLGHKLRGVSVAREYEEGLPKVPGRGGELNQVWTNLLDNAADAVAGGGGIRVRAFRDGGAVVVEVEDDGPGIPPEIEGRVFEPFFTTKEVGSGAGLGLDVVRRIVVGHGGEIHLETGPGRTRFAVRLPLEIQTQNGG